MYCLENARVQKSATSVDLSDIVNHAALLRLVDGYIADVLLRVRGLAVGHRQTRRAMHGMRGQVPREVQGAVERRLFAK